MLQTVISYGDLTILHCQTRRFEQEHVSDPSGVDHEYARVTITVDGWLRVSGSGGSTLSSGVRVAPNNMTNIGLQRDAVGQRLYHPRSPFRMSSSPNEDGTGGHLLMQIQPATADGNVSGSIASGDFSGLNEYFDVCGGPRCTQLDQENKGGVFAKVTATFVLCFAPCVPESGSIATTVLSNRWNVRDSIDDNQYTTRTYSGRLRVSTPLVNPNTFRGQCLPTLAPGMRLHSADFEVTPDGLTLGYTIVHRESPFAAPTPATSMEVVHTETTGDGKLSFGSCQVTLKGNRNVNKKDLIALALAVIDSKLLVDFENARANDVAIIENLTITDITSSHGPNTISVSCDVMHSKASDEAILAGVAARLGKPLEAADFVGTVAEGYDSRISHQLPGGDSDSETTEKLCGPISLAGAFSAYLQMVCDGPKPISEGLTASGEPPATTNGPQVSVREVDDVSENPPQWVSASHKDAIYTSYEIESKWETRKNRIQLPIAESSGISTADTACIIGVGRGTTRRFIRIRASRIGDQPQLQEPKDTIDGAYVPGGPISMMHLTLAHKKILPTYEITNDGKPHWIVDAEYLYLANREPLTTEDLLIGVDDSLVGPARKLNFAALTTINESSTIT